MKKNITMRKGTFVKGAMITTLGIVISKILGLFYVVPFYAIIGEQGGALYGYAYTIYTLFMSLASLGIPLAISKIVSEYQTLGYYQTKKRVFVLGKRIAWLLGFTCFLLILIFAPLLARAVLGDVTGGNTIADVTFVIRVIGTAILIVPVLSIYRGYFEGHRLFSPPSISQVIEQIIRVLIIILGSYFAISTFHLSLPSAVAIALLGATAGAFLSYLYLAIKKYKNRSKFNEKIREVNEPKITDKMIIQKIFLYSIPFILIDVFKSIYNYVDMVTVVKSLVHLASYNPVQAENIYGILSTWGAKFNMILLSISTGVVVSLIPNLTESIVKKEMKDVNKKINQALGILFYFMIPMTLGISFLAKPIWILFYGNSLYGPSILSYYIFVGLAIGIFTVMVTILQTLKDQKSVFFCLLVGVLIKILFNRYFILVFEEMHLPAYYGVITASILGYCVSLVAAFIILRRKYGIHFEDSLKNFIDIMCASLLMVVVLSIMKIFIPISFDHRMMNILSILWNMVVGMIVYFVYCHMSKVTHKIFGKSLFQTFGKLILRK